MDEVPEGYPLHMMPVLMKFGLADAYFKSSEEQVMEDRLIMPTEEMVGDAIDVLRVAMKGGLVKEQVVTAAVAVLDAYARLRPLQKTLPHVS